MKILVTGGSGFIGSNFIRFILNRYQDDSIINLDNLTYAGNPENLSLIENNERYKFVRGDIADPSIVDLLVSESDAIVHFAAESHVDRSIEDSSQFIRTNIVGTHVLLEAARRHGGKRFHHVSTDEVFGSLEQNGASFFEETAYNPRSPYSASKAASDHLVRSYFHTYDLPVTLSNCSNNYGPYHFPEKLIPLAITNILEGKHVPVYGNGKQIRDWLFVEDHCAAIDLILRSEKYGETYCVGGDFERENIWIIRKLIEKLGASESAIHYVCDRPGHDFRYSIDSSKLRKDLSWSPSVSLEDGLEYTVQWYQENGQWWKRVKSGEYRLGRSEESLQS